MKHLHSVAAFVLAIVACFGTHQLTADESGQLTADEPGQLTADELGQAENLFNGKDLTGWKAEGGARWEVKDGLLVGRPGLDESPGDLFTKATYEDFELTVTYKVVWPANSGIWYRYQSAKKTYQADILEYKDPIAYSGTLYRPGRPGELFLAINDDRKLVNKEGWNTMVIRAEGDHHVIRLNGTQVADVRNREISSGRIGFQVHGGSEFANMQIIVKHVRIRKLRPHAPGVK